MDDRGNIYADDATAFDLQEQFGRKIAKPIEQAPAGTLPIETRKLLNLIAGMNRRQRRLYYAKRKLGHTPDEALAFIRDVPHG